MSYPDLAALGAVLWNGADVRTGPIDPAGDSLVGTADRSNSSPEEYVALPSLAKPRYLLPATLTPEATARLLREYNALRAPRPRLARAALATAAGAGWIPGRRTQRVSVSFRRGVQGLPSLVAEELGRNAHELRLACGVRVDFGVARPIVTVVDLNGQPVLFLKIARTPLHQRRLASEHAMLLATHRWLIPGVQTPRPAFLRAWCDNLVLATAPLPSEVSALGPAESARATAALAALTDSGDPSDFTPAESPWIESLRERAGHLEASAREHLTQVIDSTVRRHDDVSLPHGPGHGDWSFWNMAQLPSSGDIALWDWEFGHRLAPLGLDRLHWAFAVSTTIRHTPIGEVGRSQQRRHRDSEPEGAAISALHLLEMVTRRLEEGDIGNKRSNNAAHELLGVITSELADGR